MPAGSRLDEALVLAGMSCGALALVVLLGALLVAALGSRRQTMTRKKREPRPSQVPPHAFEDEDKSGTALPRDFHSQRYCGRCGLPGEPGDERHPAGALPLPRSFPLPPTPADAREVDARRLGERGAA
jgi:hypothetical protein